MQVDGVKLMEAPGWRRPPLDGGPCKSGPSPPDKNLFITLLAISLACFSLISYAAPVFQHIIPTNGKGVFYTLFIYVPSTQYIADHSELRP